MLAYHIIKCTAILIGIKTYQAYGLWIIEIKGNSRRDNFDWNFKSASQLLLLLLLYMKLSGSKVGYTVV